MFDKLSKMIRKLTDDVFFIKETNREIDKFFEDPDKKNMDIEEDMNHIIDAFKTTRLPFDTFYYSTKHKQFMLVTHVFAKKEDADIFEQELKKLFKKAQIENIQDKQGRSFIHMNPRTITEDEFSKCMSLHKAQLFKAPSGYYDNKSRTAVKLLLDSLYTTDVPMDTLYFNYEDNAFYIVSHVFIYQDKCQAFAGKLREFFGERSVSVLEDVPGRYFIHLNPGEIKKEVFDCFYKTHQQVLFSKQKEESRFNFQNTLEHARFIMSGLRHSAYPMGCIYYDNRTDGFYLTSHVFANQERAKNYFETFQECFNPGATKLVSDIQQRHFVYLDPSQIDKEKFDQFLKEHQEEVF